MPTTQEYAKYVADQLSKAGEVTYKKLFGEYGLWLEGKFFGTVEDNQFYIKITDAGREMLPEAEPVAPHGGNPNMYLVEEIEDTDFLAELVRRTCEQLPEAKKRAASKQKGGAQKMQIKDDLKKAAKLDYKKEYRDLYQPKKKPSIIQVPRMLFIMVDGKGDPNTSSEYKAAMEILYGLSYSIKMSKMSGNQPEGYFEYVVPPLEGLWWSEGGYIFDGVNNKDKDKFLWTSMIRQPEFVTAEVFEQAKATLKKKKPEIDFSNTRLEWLDEGLCAQIMHIGPYEDEPESVEKLEQFITESGYILDLTETRKHHEIYLGDPRKIAPEKQKTVIRHPIRKA